MTDSPHIPEPWEVGYGRPLRPYLIATCDPKILDIMPTAVPHDSEALYVTGGTPTVVGPYLPAIVGPANARRIVQCVNACAGLELPEATPVGALKVLVETGLRILDVLYAQTSIEHTCSACGADLRYEGHRGPCYISDLEQALWMWLPRAPTKVDEEVNVEQGVTNG